MADLILAADNCPAPSRSTSELFNTCVEVDPKHETDAASQQLSFLNDNLTWLSLMVAFAVLLGAVALWALSSTSQNSQISFQARKAVVACFVAAFFIGALPALVAFWVRFGAENLRP